MYYLSLLALLLASFTANAGAIPDNLITKGPSLVIVPSGMISPTPIISDATFARIAKKNDLSSKSFGDEDLKKLDAKFIKVVNTLKKGHVF